MVKVTLINGDVINIEATTKIHAYKALDAKSGSKPYYSEQVYDGTITDGKELDVTNPAISISGLVASTDFIEINDSGYKFIKTSAVANVQLTD